VAKADVIVTPPGGGERFDRGNRVVTILGDFPQLSANEIEFDTSFEVPSHVHDDHVDAFYVLEGEVEFLLESGSVRAGPGTFVAAPPGMLHGFRTDGPGRARVLNFHGPDAGFAASVRSQ
jgi:quercetin dioxygenase-like cupin family protein